MKNKKLWTQETIKILRESSNKNLSAKDISRLTGFSQDSVRHKANSLELKLNTIYQQNWTNSEIKILKELYPLQGVSKELLSRLNRTEYSIRWKVKDLGLKMVKELRNILCGNGQRNHSKIRLIHDKIINIDEPETAYVLGFLWADGCLRNGKKHQSITFLNLKSDIDEIRDVLLKTGNWSFSTTTNTAGNQCTKGYIGGYDSYKYLMSLGYYDKSRVSAEKILEKIPENLRHYWWRGYFDGDGCLKRHRLKHCIVFSSTKEQDWSFTKFLPVKRGNIFIQTKIINGKIQGGSQWRITNKEETLQLLEYMYQGYPKDNIGFSRKYAIYKEKYLK